MKVTGDNKHRSRLRRIRGPEARREVGKAIYVVADYHATEASLSITAGSVSGKYHVPSKPGEPPNADTQVLNRSIHTEPVNQLKALSVADAPYAAALEEGSERKAGTTSRSFAGKESPYGPSKAKQGPVKVEFGDSKTAARPYMAPAAVKTRPRARKLIDAAISKVIGA